jgi:hypothetical protein
MTGQSRTTATRALAAFAASVLVALVAVGAAQAREAYSFSSKGVSADAYWESCTTERGLTTCTFSNIYAFQGTERSRDTGTMRGTTVCFYTETFTYRSGPGQGPGGESSFESGCSSAPSGTLSVSNDLTSATLGASTVTIWTYECTEEDCVPVTSREVTVSGWWTAGGPLFSFSERFKFDDGTCTYTFSGKGQGRDGVATGTVDGTSLGESGYASISSGMFTERYTCA